MKAIRSKKSKCRICRRFIPLHLRHTSCNSCKGFVHAKCSNREISPNGSWECSHCIQRELPFCSISDETLRLSLGGLEQPSFLNLKLLPNSSIRSLVEKIPGHMISFDEISISKNASKYYDINDFLDSKFDPNTSLGIFHMNTSSLSKNFDELCILLKSLSYKFKIIGISETRLTGKFGENLYVELDGYSFVDTKTLSNAGGTGLYIHNSLKGDFKIRHDLCFNIENGFEATFVEISTKGRKNLICGCIYKHPSFSPENFLDECFLTILQKVNIEDKFVVIMGDFNIDLLAYDRFVASNDFYDMAGSYCLQPLILQPSRVTLRSQTLIDNIFSNNNIYNSVSGNLTCSISDHFAQFTIFTDYNRSRTKTKTKPVYGRSYKTFTESEFQEELSYINWNSLFGGEQSPDILTNIIVEKVTDILNVMAPFKRLTKKELSAQQKPWITKDIFQAMKIRDDLLKVYVKEKDQQARTEAHIKYKRQRNIVVSMLKRSKRLYYSKYFLENKHNIRKTWDGITSILKQNKKSKNFPAQVMNQKGSLTKAPKDIATAFNSYFSSIGKSLDANIPNSNNSFMKYMPPFTAQSIFLNPTDPSEIVDLINALSVSKACGPSSIPTNLLKAGSSFLATPISYMINQSFNLGIFPSVLKLSKVIPVYKSGSPELCANYRPISLLSNLSKILEKAMHKRINEFLNKFNLIYKLQFGFRKHHSTNHALINLITCVFEKLDAGEYACGLFLDLQKAFDTVNQNILLKKLAVYGIRGVCLNWFESYLHGRRQFVAIENENSEVEGMEFGVPQGSILGPLLFLIYINDFRLCLSSGTAQHFADDTIILNSSKSTKKIKANMSRDITSIYDWLCANRLSLNAKKTEVMLFQPKNKKEFTKMTLKIKETKISVSNKVKYLGVILDSRLTWRDHLSELSKKLSRANGLLSKIRHYADTGTLVSLYYSLFHSHMTYGSLAWGSARKDELNRIQKLQNQALRIMTFSDFREPTSTLFSKFGILKLDGVINMNLHLFMHDWYHLKLPEAFINFFNFSANSSTRLSALHKLTLPTRRTESYGSSNIKFKGASVYNQLIDLNININKSKNLFKKEIKTLLMAAYV